MSRIRILFMGTPEFAVPSLQHLIDDSHYEIVGVVSQPDRPAGRKMQLKASPVKELALKHGLRVWTPESVNKSEIQEELKALGAECAVVVAFGQILSQKFIDLFAHGCVNIHASVLPRWRGAAPIQRAIMAGDRDSGVSLQVVVKKLDAGAVLGLRRQRITDSTDAIALHEALRQLAPELLHVELMDYLRGNLTGQVQNEAEVTVAPKIDKAEGQINWSRSAHEIFNLIRGLTMGPVAWCQRDGQRLKLWQTRVLKNYRLPQGTVPGQVVEVSAESFTVACGQDALEVLEVQPESRSRMPVREYLRGYPMTAGETRF